MKHLNDGLWAIITSKSNPRFVARADGEAPALFRNSADALVYLKDRDGIDGVGNWLVVPVSLLWPHVSVPTYVLEAHYRATEPGAAERT